jgi:ATP-dependent metalloprotease
MHDQHNINLAYRYIRELNRQRKYKLASEVATKTGHDNYQADAPLVAKLISYQNDYALDKMMADLNLDDMTRNMKRPRLFLIKNIVVLVLFWGLFSSFFSSFRGVGEGGFLQEIMLGGNVNESEQNIPTRFSDVLGID